jgi:hypothetical protein
MATLYFKVLIIKKTFTARRKDANKIFFGYFAFILSRFSGPKKALPDFPAGLFLLMKQFAIAYLFTTIFFTMIDLLFLIITE